MIEENFLNELKADYQANESKRRQIISTANEVLFQSKKIIFALQRQDSKQAEQGLEEVEKTLSQLDESFGANRLVKEGAYRAAAEEYLEAKIFSQLIKGEAINSVAKLNFEYEAYLGGLCDAIGELVRYATNQAAQGNFSAVGEIKMIAEGIMGQLIDFDLTSYLRTKYDQARGHLRKLEQMSYEIKLRTGK
ncbi:MAG: translin family protein [Patescibacteria group bacterium]|jgi:translin